MVVLALAVSGQSAGQNILPSSIPELLDRYRTGEFGVAVQLAAATESAQLRTSFIAAADGWIARDSADPINRRLVATAFAIELAHARLNFDNVTLVLLLDWARKEWQKGPSSSAERLWLRAAVALVGRGGRMSTLRAGGWDNMERSAKFLDDAVKRFPEDARLRLAKLVWLPPIALRNARPLERLTENAEVGPEALVELAYVRFSEGNTGAAGRLAAQAASRAAEPWTRYLAHFIAGIVHEFHRRYPEAAVEYSAALSVMPHAQSASIALAQLRLRNNQADAAFDLIERTLAEQPDGDDPWRLFPYGAYVRWPVLIADVRKAIR